MVELALSLVTAQQHEQIKNAWNDKIYLHNLRFSINARVFAPLMFMNKKHS